MTCMCCGTFEERTALPDSDGTRGSILAQAELHEEQRHSREEEHDEVRDEKHTCKTTQDDNSQCDVMWTDKMYTLKAMQVALDKSIYQRLKFFFFLLILVVNVYF